MKKANKVYIVAGLGFGDEGKGSILDFIASGYQSPDVIRYNGGSQAAHTVVTPEGLTHIFSQFGSASLLKNARTFLSPQMLIDPISILQEDLVLKEKGIRDAMKRLTIDSDCVMITPIHKMIGQINELIRGKKRHSSTGKGVGQAVLDCVQYPETAIRIRDCFSDKSLVEKLEANYQLASARILSPDTDWSKDIHQIYQYYKENYPLRKLFNSYKGFVNSYADQIDREGEFIENSVKSGNTILFEGAQGILLDPVYGFYPYITKTNTGFAYAAELLPEDKENLNIERIGVMRAYSHRHGNGPLVTESRAVSEKINELHNTYNPWQGKFRMGWFDLLTARYAVEAAGDFDSIALTCIDQLDGFPSVKVCISYEYVKPYSKDLENYFSVKRIRGKIILTAIRKLSDPSPEMRIKQTRYLSDCIPYQYLEFKGWEQKYETVNSPADLPVSALKYIDFIASAEGLNRRISILSFGNSRANKIFYTT